MDKIRIYIALLFCQAISFILPVQAQNNTGSNSNWYNPYGGLMANSTNGRCHVMDPLCEKYYDVSPYAYCAGDPINAIDTDGKSTWVINHAQGQYKVVGGNLDDKDRNIYIGSFIKKCRINTIFIFGDAWLFSY